MRVDRRMGKGTNTGTPLATHDHEAGGLDQTLEFLKRTRSELRQLRRVLVGEDRLRVCDVNRDVIRDRRPGLCRPGHHRPSEQHQHRVRPPDPPPANRCRVQGVQPRPLPSLGRGPGDVKAARRLQASRSGAAIRTSVNEDGSGTRREGGVADQLPGSRLWDERCPRTGSPDLEVGSLLKSRGSVTLVKP